MRRNIVVLVTTIVVAGCSGALPSATPPPTPSPTTAPTATATLVATPSPSPQPTEIGPSPSPESEGIPVYMGGTLGPTGPQLFFNPPTITVSGGDVTFLLTNPTEAPHDMVIGPQPPACTATDCTFGPTIAESAIVGARGGPMPFTAEGLAAGIYSYWCTISDHAALGMIGKLTVEP